VCLLLSQSDEMSVLAGDLDELIKLATSGIKEEIKDNLGSRYDNLKNNKERLHFIMCCLKIKNEKVDNYEEVCAVEEFMINCDDRDARVRAAYREGYVSQSTGKWVNDKAYEDGDGLEDPTEEVDGETILLEKSN
jgi:hypothetical protein